METLQGFHKETVIDIGPRTQITKGERVTIRKHPGRWKFLALVQPRDNRRAPWVDVVQVSGSKNQVVGGIRSFPASDVNGRAK